MRIIRVQEHVLSIPPLGSNKRGINGFYLSRLFTPSRQQKIEHINYYLFWVNVNYIDMIVYSRS